MRDLIAVFVGGATGTLGRYGLDQTVGTVGAWPLSTFVINLSGSFLLGIVVMRVPDSPRRRLLGTGLLGGFTTYSALAGQTSELLRDGQPQIAVAYAVMTIVLGLGAAVAGVVVGARR